MKEEGNDLLKPIFLTVILVVALVSSTVITIKYLEPQQYIYEWLFDNKVYEVSKASDNLPISTQPQRTISIEQMIEIRHLLENRQFEQLNNILEEYQNIFEEDQTDEYKVFDAYEVFFLTIPSYEEFLKAWVSAYPDKEQPHLAMAQYYYAKGWESRGYKWAKDTSREHFEKMRFYFSKAEDHIKIVLETNENSIVAYSILIGIYNVTGNDEALDEIIQRSLERFHYSFMIRSVISWAKQPRWGGSYELMEKIAKEAEPYSDVNPELTKLYGFIYYDQGRRFEHNKKYEKAIDLYTKALSYGESSLVYKERAETYHFYLKEYDQALEDINRSIVLQPTGYKFYRLRSRIHFAKENYADSIEDLRTAELIRPGDPETQEWKDGASKSLLNKGHRLFKTDFQEAIKMYNLSLDFNDADFEAYYWRGVASYRLEDYESALEDFKNVIEINPRYFEAYRMLDYIFAKDRQWGAIIAYWDAFLKLEPDHAEAYLERAGTHYHNNNIEKARDDLKISCDLGNKEACKRLKSLKD